MPRLEWTTPEELPPVSDMHHQVRRLQSLFMETAAMARDYLHPAEPPMWVELFRLMGSWHLNDVTDLNRYFNNRFPRHGMAVLEARADIDHWLDAVRTRLQFSGGMEADLCREQSEKLASAASKLDDIIRQCGIGQNMVQ